MLQSVRFDIGKRGGVEANHDLCLRTPGQLRGSKSKSDATLCSVPQNSVKLCPGPKTGVCSKSEEVTRRETRDGRHGLTQQQHWFPGGALIQIHHLLVLLKNDREALPHGVIHPSQQGRTLAVTELDELARWQHNGGLTGPHPDLVDDVPNVELGLRQHERWPRKGP